MRTWYPRFRGKGLGLWGMARTRRLLPRAKLRKCRWDMRLNLNGVGGCEYLAPCFLLRARWRSELHLTTNHANIHLSNHTGERERLLRRRPRTGSVVLPRR